MMDIVINIVFLILGGILGWSANWYFYRRSTRASDRALKLQMLAAEDLGAHVAWGPTGEPAGISHTSRHRDECRHCTGEEWRCPQRRGQATERISPSESKYTTWTVPRPLGRKQPDTASNESPSPPALPAGARRPPRHGCRKGQPPGNATRPYRFRLSVLPL